MNSLLLALTVLIFEFAPAEFYSWLVIAAAGLLVLAIRPKFFFSLRNPAAPLVGLLLIGMVFSLNNPLGAAAKDIWYLLKPIAIVSLGLMFAYMFRTDRRWIKNISVVLLIVSFANIVTAFSSDQLEGITARPTSYAVAFLAPFIWKYYPTKTVSALLFRVVIVLLAAAMILISESRAALMTFGVGWLAAFGTLERGGRTLFVFGLLVFAITALFPLLPQYDFQGARFLAKLQNSINEVMFETGDTRLSMYRNWRGFEAHQAYMTWIEASLPEKIVGLGHGSEINLARLVTFNEEGVESLHSIHNSYFALLVKTGVLGVVAFLAFMIRPFFAKRGVQSDDVEIYSRIVRGGALALLLTSALVSGPLNKTSLDGLLLIWSVAYGTMLFREGSLSRGRQVSSMLRSDLSGAIGGVAKTQ